MLRVLRLRRWSIAPAVLLSLLAATASPALSLHASDDHDAACIPITAAPHDESAHRLASHQRGDAPHPLHCLVCHWARAFRPLSATPAHQSPNLEPRARIHFDALPAPITLASAQLTLRSPPSTPFAL